MKYKESRTPTKANTDDNDGGLWKFQHYLNINCRRKSDFDSMQLTLTKQLFLILIQWLLAIRDLLPLIMTASQIQKPLLGVAKYLQGVAKLTLI